MNSKDQERVNANLRLLDPAFRRLIGMVRYNTGNTEEHEMTKALVCFRLARSGVPFVTEAVFTNGGRCDVFDLLNGVAIEVVCSERENSIVRKMQQYPVPISTISAYAGD